MILIPEEWRHDLPLIRSAVDVVETLRSLDEAQAADLPALLGRISRSAEHRILVRRVAQRWLEEPRWVDGINSVPGNLVLSEAANGNIFALGFSLGVNRAKPRVSVPIDTMLTALCPQGLTINVSELRGDTNFSVVDPSLSVSDPRAVSCAQHETIALRCGTVFDYADTSSMILKVELRHHTQLRFHFDGIDGRFLGASLPNAIESQLLAFIQSLRTTGTPDMAPVLAGYARHRSHWVRWETVKTLAALDEALALDVIRGLIDDPHPEIRDAVAATLEGA